jgi:hypothetical protein
MKKVMMVIIAFSFASITMLSCTQKAEDIKLSDLKTACDFVSALGKVADAGIKWEEKYDKVRKEDEFDSEAASKSESGGLEELEIYNKRIKEKEDKLWAEREVLKKKLREITEAAGKKYTEIGVKECPDFEMLEKKFKDSGLPLN